MSWADGSYFEGDWQMDRRVKGVMRMSDNIKYTGTFKDDLYHGKGSL